MLAAALPIAPTMQLKSVCSLPRASVPARPAEVAGALSGIAAGLSGAFGSATVAKVAVVSAIAGERWSPGKPR